MTSRTEEPTMAGQTAAWVVIINDAGATFASFAAAMLLQVSLLLIALACLDLLVLRKSRAVLRYAVWSLVLVKLLLPVGLQGPLSVTGLLDAISPRAYERAPHNSLIMAGSPWGSGGRPQIESGSTSTNTLTGAASVAATRTADAIPAVDLPRAGSHPSALQWPGGLLIAWFVGVIMMAALLVQRFWQVRRLMSTAWAPPAALENLLRDCQRLLALERKPIRLAITNQLSSPAICGLWRATILVPRPLADRLDAEQMRLVFIHELVHWKRFDLH